MCKCGLNHRGWEENLCRIELAKRANATVSTQPIKSLLCDPGELVLAKKPKNKPVARNAPDVARNSTARVAELRKRKTESGLIEVRGIWANLDDMEAIKRYAKELAEKRC